MNHVFVGSGRLWELAAGAVIAVFAISNPNWIVAAAAVVNVFINLAVYVRAQRKKQ